MDRIRKVAIGYDGSLTVDVMIADLKRSGLPDKIHALIISVADVLVPPATTGDAAPPLPPSIAASFRKSQDEARQLIDDAETLSRTCATALNVAFPSWKIETSAFADSPAWGILNKSQEWGANLIVVGAHGLATPARLLLGSVSQRVVNDATCSVRIIHREPQGKAPVRIVVGVDGSEHSDRAIAEIVSRRWSDGAEAYVVTAIDQKLVSTIASTESPVRHWINADDRGEYHWVNALVNDVAAKLRANGLTVKTRVEEGSPKSLLLKTAEDCRADCIFVGARGMSGMRHLLLGSVSSAVASRAECTVEVVR